MKKTTVSVLALLLTLGLGMSLSANLNIQKAFKAKYPEATALGKCTTCHVKPLPKKDDHENNAYGNDLKATKKGDKYDFAAIEKKDSDGDGVSNIDEIKKGTNPGDKNSK